MMVHKLQDGDRLIFLPNLLKNGNIGDSIVTVKLYWTGQSFITDDDKLQLFPELQNLYFQNRNKFEGFRPYTRHYTYVIVNGDYKLVYFGFKIYSMLEMNKFNTDRIFNISIEEKSGFPCFDNCHFSNEFHNKTFDVDFLKTKTTYIEDIIDNWKWTRESNYKILLNFLKSKDINIDPLKALNLKQREIKLERILK